MTDGFDELLPLVYDELRGMAEAQMRKERTAHTLQPTALAHEAYLRLRASFPDEFDRTQFLCCAARAMRQILIDHARARGRVKRGGGRRRVTLHDSDSVKDVDVLDLNEALAELTGISERRARIVELRFFAGLTAAEIAGVLGISKTTADDEWYLARAWLHRRLEL